MIGAAEARSARKYGVVAFGLGLAARLAVVAWGYARFPAVEDGRYYDTLAHRIAEGHGYTWLWPDGAVTYVAHYPVGYPALLGAAYAAFGPRLAVAMSVNALLGALATLAVYRLVLHATHPRRALVAAAVFALHPALLAYTPAIMTEGAAASLLVIAAALSGEARAGRERAWLLRAAAAVVLGVATLVRPQCLAFAPLLGAIAIRGSLRARTGGAALATAVALAVCAPWTVRNCARMDRCALVSMNGGWNLLIGERSTTGGWAPVEPPDACKTVWDEAKKDVCFEREARARIAGDVLGWLSRAPAKVAMTFDYFGAAPWYLHASNPDAFDGRAKLALAAVETVFSRALLALALFAVARVDGPRPRARAAIAVASGVFTLLVHAWVAYVGVAAAILALGPRALARAPVVLPWTAGVVLLTAATHAVFFGAGRYGLVVVPFVTALAFVAPRARPMPPVESASLTSSAKSGDGSRSSAARS